MNDLHLKCDCGVHELQIHRDGEDLEVSLWAMQGERPLNWRGRIRWCWRILRTGNPWVDFILLGPAKTQQLREWLGSGKADTRSTTNAGLFDGRPTTGI